MSLDSAMTRFPLGCSTAVFRPEPVCERHFRSFAEAGVNIIELTCVHKYIEFHDAQVVERVIDWIRQCGLTAYSVHAPFYDGVDLSATDDGARRASINEVGVALEIAVRLGSKVLVVHSAPEVKVPRDRPARLAAVKESLSELSRQCGKRGIKLAIEFLPRLCLGNSLDEMLQIIAPLNPDNAGVCLDVNHANFRDDLLDVTRGLGERIASLHVSDNDGIDERHWPPFKGVIDWHAFARALERTPFEGPFMYEVYFQDEDAPAVADRFRILRETYQRIWLCE